MKEKKNDLVLAIETGIDGGSLSFFLNGRELSYFIGSKNVSKSEDLLLAIDEQLRQISYNKTDIKTLLVSEGPGSYTGLRIGRSTAYGIQNSLKCAVHFISVLDAMTALSNDSKNIICCINLSKTDLVWSQFEIKEKSVKTIQKNVIQKKNEFKIDERFEYLVDSKIEEHFKKKSLKNVECLTNSLASTLNIYHNKLRLITN